MNNPIIIRKAPDSFNLFYEEPSDGEIFCIDRVAWMGGSSISRKDFREYGNVFHALVRFFFEEQITDYKTYWKESPIPDHLDIAKTFFNRAVGDAWATYREM